MKKIFISPELTTILKDIVESNPNDKTIVAQSILEVSKDGINEDYASKEYCNYFTLSKESKKFISYVKKEKLAEKIIKYNDDITKKSEVTNEMLQEFNDKFFSRKVARVRAKPGKLVSRIFSKSYIEDNIRARDIEFFTNQYTAIVRDKVDFRLVKGNDIKKYYLGENYDQNCPGGSLRGSCMKDEDRNKFMDFYAKNDNVSMLVAFSENNKVIARAIIWDNVKFYKNGKLIDDGSLMDRIYFTYDWLESKFKKWGKEEGCYVKYRQSHDAQTQFISPNGDVQDLKVEVPLNLRFEFYPYMDTISHPDYNKGVLTNYRVRDDFKQLRAHSTGKPNTVFDFIGGKAITTNNAKWSNHSETYIHLDDSIEVESEYFHKKVCEKDRIGGFITPADERVKCAFTGDEFAKREMVESEYHDGLIHKKESIKSVDAGLIHKDDSVKSNYLGKTLSKKGSVKLEKVDDYLPKEILDSGVDIEQLEKVIQSLKKIQGDKNTEDDSSTFIFEF